MKNRTQIIMIEDDLDFCKAIEEMLLINEDFEIVKSFQTCTAFLEEFQFKNWEEISIFWIDLNLPDGSAIPIIPKIKSMYPNSKCLVCTFQSDDSSLFNALKFGADGYVLKDTGINMFLQSLKDIMLEGAAMSPSIAKKIIHSFHLQAEPSMVQMTRRENEVLGLLAKGLLYKEISDQLQISIETTKKHISNIYQKLHVQNRTEAVLKFLQR